LGSYSGASIEFINSGGLMFSIARSNQFAARAETWWNFMASKNIDGFELKYAHLPVGEKEKSYLEVGKIVRQRQKKEAKKETTRPKKKKNTREWEEAENAEAGKEEEEKREAEND
jgi:hypothetical protein